MTNRKELLPLWIRFSSWIFLLFSASSILIIVGIVMGYTELNVFGIHYFGNVLRPLPLFMILIMTCHGIAAFGLLWSKRWGVNAAIACGLLGATLSVIGMVTAHTQGKSHFEFSIIAQVLFLIALFSIREKWLMQDVEKS